MAKRPIDKKKAARFRELEEMFRQYRLWQLRLAALQPRLVARSGAIIPPRLGLPHRPVENLAVKRADLTAMIRRVQLVMRAMTRDEERFIQLRYFNGFPMRFVAAEMRWSRSQVYRLRISILAKAAWILDALPPLHQKPETFFAQKTS